MYTNYVDSLSKNGFQELFQCKNTACGGRNFNHAVASYGFFGEDYEDQRYYATKLIREEGDVYVSLYVAMHNDGSKQNNNRVRVQLDIIELKPMETNMVVVDAEAMAKGLNAEGHIAIYAVYFDTDSAELKPASTPALPAWPRAGFSYCRSSLALVNNLRAGQCVGQTWNEFDTMGNCC